MAFDVTGEDIDMGFNALFRSLSEFDGAVVETGLHDPTEAQKGIWQEYGTRDIPARPWLSVAADTVVGAVESEGRSSLRSFGPNSKAKATLNGVGKVTKEHTRGVILSQKVGGPPLQAETIDRKGHALKLIDSGDMLAAIDAKVKMRGEP